MLKYPSWLKGIHRVWQNLWGKPQDIPPRVVWLNGGDKNKGFPKNKIVTSKYKAWNFIPKNLLEQFRRVANFYFLCICIIVLSIVSPVSPVTTILPLAIVVLITMIKQGIEDVKRRKNDKEINNKVVKVIRDKVEMTVKARDIKVGDLVVVHRDEDVPCDLVLLGSSDPDGKAFLTTANLDGETNLKTKTVPHMLRLFPNEHLAKMDARIECEPPNSDLYNFYGKIQVFPGDDAGVYGSLMRRAGRGRSALGPPPPVKRNSVAYGEVGEEGRRSLKRIGLVVGEGEEGGGAEGGKQGVGGEETDDPQAAAAAQGVRLSRDAEDGGFPLRRFSVGISAPLDQENLLLRCTTLRNTDRVYGCAVYTGQETRMSLNSLLTHHKFSVIERKVNWFLLFFLGVLVVEIVISMVLKYEDERKTAYGKQTYMKDFYNTSAKRIVVDILSFIVIYNYVIPISLYVTMELQKFFGAMWFSHDLNIWDEEMKERAMYNTTDINEDMGQVEVLLTDKTGTLTQNEMKFKRCVIGDNVYAEEDGVMLELTGDGDVRNGTPVSELTPEMEEFFITLALCNTVQLETAEQHAPRPELSEPLSKKELKALQKKGEQKKKGEEGKEKKEGKGGTESKRGEGRQKEAEDEEDEEEEETEEERKKRLEKKLEGVPESRKKHEMKRLEWEDDQRKMKKEKERMKRKREKEKMKQEEEKEEMKRKGSATVVNEAGKDKETGVEGQGDQPKKEEGPLGPQGPFYAATNPDEKSLVEAAARQGVILKEIKGDEIILEVKGKPRKFRKVDVLEFTPERKRMSVIVEDEKGRILLLCKGADSSVIPLTQSGGGKKGSGSEGRLRGGGESGGMNSSDVDMAVTDFSKRGLRVLVVASRELPRDELMARGREVEEARQTVSSERARLMERAYERLEQGVEVLGATAVEDALQENVQGTLESLRAAGIRVWVLTGDNMDTAINISYACGHFKEGTEQLQLVQAQSVEGCSMAMMRLLDHVMDDRYRQYGLVVDGQSLAYALERPGLFRDVAFCCYAVICCRLSPLQKSEVVTVIKKAPSKPITAAIGDGANDVSMILEAHVGFGLMGREGRQAVRSADFAFARFRYLQKALLVHGHWYYERLATLVLYFFYKNVVFIFPQFYFGFYSSFSTQPLYDFVFLMTYNVLFTSLPILIYGLFEQAAPARDLYDFPRYYRSITQNALMRWSVFFQWIGFGVWHSLVVFFVPILTVEYFNAVMYINNQPLDDTGLGTIVYHNVVWVVNLKLLLHSRYWTWIFALSIGISVFGFMVLTITYSLIKLNGHAMYYVYIYLLMSPMFWLISIFTVVLCLTPDVAYLVIIKYIPELQQMWHRIKLKRNKGGFDVSSPGNALQP